MNREPSAGAPHRCVCHWLSHRKDAGETPKGGAGSGDASSGLHFTHLSGTKNIFNLPAFLIYSHSHTMALFKKIEI